MNRGNPTTQVVDCQTISMSISQVCQAIESTWLSTAVRESIWGFPILLGVHSPGLGLSVGTLFWFDLRLLRKSIAGMPVGLSA